MFCQHTGFGGTTQRVDDLEKLKQLKPVADSRVLRITFNCDVSDTMPWRFKPEQPDIKVSCDTIKLQHSRRMTTLPISFVGCSRRNGACILHS